MNFKIINILEQEMRLYGTVVPKGVYKYTFMLEGVNGLVWVPLDFDRKYQYQTTKEAETAAEEYINWAMNTVAIVTKNSDFTEGRGPMVFHKVFRSLQDAHDYVMQQSGIYGSKQKFSCYFGCSVGKSVDLSQMLYASMNYNGYSINLCEIN